jgi:hypothetical protein
MDRRILSLCFALALTGAFGFLGKATARAEEPQSPDTNGLSAAMTQMSEQMLAGTPEAQMKKLEYEKSDSWAAFDLTRSEVDTGMGAGTVVKAMVGLGGPKTWLVVPGDKADLDIHGPRPLFRFSGEKQEAMKIELAALEPHNGKRRTQIAGGSQTEFFKKNIELAVKKVEDGVWELTPKKDLEPGQYVLADSMAGPVAEFEIQ